MQTPKPLSFAQNFSIFLIITIKVNILSTTSKASFDLVHVTPSTSFLLLSPSLIAL